MADQLVSEAGDIGGLVAEQLCDTQQARTPLFTVIKMLETTEFISNSREYFACICLDGLKLSFLFYIQVA